MPYDDPFYRRYAEYLDEFPVRHAHDWVFSLIASDRFFKNVIDLGCGCSQEFRRTCPTTYIGMDINAAGDDPEVLATNYRAINWTDPIMQFACRKATAFVSLFSTEITAPVSENYAFYNRLFHSLPNLKVGLVSGFYYTDDRKGKNPVRETGDIVSNQTLEQLHEVGSDRFSERRIVMRVPSKMFGDSVFEVWKIFERR